MKRISKKPRAPQAMQMLEAVESQVGARWRTKSGIVVEERGRYTDNHGLTKIAGYRVATGGFHGLLHLKRLKLVRR